MEGHRGLSGAERRAVLADVDALVADGRWRDTIDLLQAHPGTSGDDRLARRLVQVRHTAVAHLDGEPPTVSCPPAVAPERGWADAIPEVSAGELDLEVTARAITHHGALIVRNLISGETAARLIDGIDRAIEGRSTWAEVRKREAGAPWFLPFVPDPDGPKAEGRLRDAEGGALWAADSPLLLHDIIETLAAAGILELAEQYLGEPPVIVLRKAVARRIPNQLARADWHQDGAFLVRDGRIRSLNTWVALSACGGNSPGLDLVPGRLPIQETGTEGAALRSTVGDGLVDRLLDGSRPVRPLFAPGDAVLFDHHLLHRTALDPATMDRPRYAIEWWSFGAGSFPDNHVPLVV